MTTGARIKAARKAAGMTQAELAAKLGISFQSVAQWENDLRNPKYETLQKIASALGVSVADLLDVKPSHAVDPNETDAEREKRLGLPEGYFKRLATPEEAARRDKLLDSFMEMNATGQQKAVEQVSDLAKIPDYQKPKPPK